MSRNLDQEKSGRPEALVQDLFSRRWSPRVLAETPIDLEDYLFKPWLTAVLITGAAELAERAILEGIAKLDAGMVSEKDLSRKTVVAAVDLARKHSHQETEDGAGPVSKLPPELQRVLRLPRELRLSFVLLLLVRLPSEFVAPLLAVEADVAHQNACLAAQLLAHGASVQFRPS